MGFEPGTVGGIFLILGAWALFYGKLKWSVALYFLADTMWVWLAWKQGDMFGVITIIIGMLLGLGVFLKSHYGIFVPDLRKN